MKIVAGLVVAACLLLMEEVGVGGTMSQLPDPANGDERRAIREANAVVARRAATTWAVGKVRRAPLRSDGEGIDT
jgi:hypothetical protein